MTSDAALLNQSLERVAERGPAFAQSVYARFFTRHPEARELFGNDDGDLRKEMMLLELLLWLVGMAEGHRDPAGCRFWAADHAAMAVTMPMVQTMFESLLQGVREAEGAASASDVDAAWRRQINVMLPHIAAGLGRTDHVAA